MAELKNPKNMVVTDVKVVPAVVDSPYYRDLQVGVDAVLLQMTNRRKLREAIEMLELAQVANERGKFHVVDDRAYRVAKILEDITEQEA